MKVSPAWDDSVSDRESRRSMALHSYDVLDTPRESDFDDLAQLAAEICGTPIGIVNLVDTHRQFFKAEVGIGVRETPLETGFCRHALLVDDFLMVPDATKDARFDGNPLVHDGPKLRFYAGAILRTPDGQPIGTVCVLDYQPRQLTEHQTRTLQLLARQAMVQLELRRALIQRRADEVRNRQILDSAIDYGIIAMDLSGAITDWNRGAQNVFGWEADEIIGEHGSLIFTPEDREADVPRLEMERARTNGRAADERWHLRKDGATFFALGEMMPLRDEADRQVGYVKIMRDRTRERRRIQRLALLGRASEALLSAEDPGEALRPILERSADTIGFDESYTYDLSPDGALPTLAHSVGASAEMRRAFERAPYDLPLGGSATQGDAPLILSNIQESDDPRHESARQAGVDAYAGFPVRNRGEMVGVIAFASRSSPSFDNESLEFFASIARFLSVARERVDNERSLRQSEERQRLAIASGEIGIFDFDMRTGKLLSDDRVRRAFGVLTDRAVSRRESSAAIHPGDRLEFDHRIAAAIEGAEFQMELRTIGIDDGILRWIALNGRIVKTGVEAGHFVGAVRDITRRVEADEKRTVLNHELAHRLKNTLAVVMSIATQTLRTAADLPSARESLMKRIQTLASAHDVLLTGQHDAGAIEAVIRSAVTLHDVDQRIAIRGPHLDIGPKAALTLALIMHELSTNAAKYGALSAPGGTVDIVWVVDVDPMTKLPTLALDWREKNGPPATQPTRKGFGTRLIEMGLSGSAGGSVELDYAAAGLSCRIVAPLTEVQANDA